MRVRESDLNAFIAASTGSHGEESASAKPEDLDARALLEAAIERVRSAFDTDDSSALASALHELSEVAADLAGSLGGTREQSAADDHRR